MEIRFDGKRALVTGAGKGLGRCIAKTLSTAGAHVIAVSRTQADLDSLKTEDPRIETLLCDIGNWDEARSRVEALGDIHLLVNNAGISKFQPAIEATPEEFDRHFTINVKALMNMSQTVAKGMIARGTGGSIVNISSVSSFMASPESMVYAGSKAAVDQMMRVMAVEWGPHQIRVNSVCPTVVKTKMGQGLLDLNPGMEQAIVDRIPQRKLPTEENIANVVLYLLSDLSDMVNGRAIPVEGGELLQ